MTTATQKSETAVDGAGDVVDVEGGPLFSAPTARMTRATTARRMRAFRTGTSG